MLFERDGLIFNGHSIDPADQGADRLYRIDSVELLKIRHTVGRVSKM